MKHQQPLDDLILFAKLVELKSFTATAEALQLSRSLISKRLSRLEERLGVQLLNRTTRRLELTEAGRTYHHYCHQIESTLREAESAVSEIRAHPKGSLNINAPVTFGQMVLTDIINRFLESYPEVKINLSLSDSYVDVIGGGFDVVVRIGKLEDSSLKARKVGTTQLHAIASRRYLEKHGTPHTPQDLRKHNCLIYRYMRNGVNEWHFKGPKGSISVPIKGNFTSDNGLPLYSAVISGLGIAMLPSFMLENFKENYLQFLLEEYMPKELGIHAIYPPAKKPPLNTRVFIDFLAVELKNIMP